MRASECKPRSASPGVQASECKHHSASLRVQASECEPPCSAFQSASLRVKALCVSLRVRVSESFAPRGSHSEARTLRPALRGSHSEACTPRLALRNSVCSQGCTLGCTYNPTGLPVRSQGCTLTQTPNQDALQSSHTVTCHSSNSFSFCLDHFSLTCSKSLNPVMQSLLKVDIATH